MQIIKANAGAYQYDIILENGLLGRLGDRISERFLPKRALLVTDENVDALYSARAMRSLEAAYIRPHKLVIRSGGYAQTLDALREISAAMSAVSLSHDDVLVVMGGAALCDTGGFAAWHHKDVVQLVQVPTTLIGMTDWAVGGKTALEYRPGTRMIGSFFPPSLILIDPQTVATMPDRPFRSGMAEVIKCGFAADAPFFRMLESISGRAAVEERMEEIAWRCLDMKRNMVGSDRHKMMMGHSIAHAIEMTQHYRGLLHGEAVALGMLAMTSYGELTNMTAKGTADRLIQCMNHYRLPMTLDVDSDGLYKRLQSLGSTLDLAIPERVGWSTVRRVDNSFLIGAWFGSV